MSQPPYQGPYPPPQGPGAPYPPGPQGYPPQGYPPQGPPSYPGGPPRGGGGRKRRRLPIVITAIVAVVLLGGVLVVALVRQESAPQGEVDFAALPAARFPKVQVPKLDAVGFDAGGTKMCGAVAKTMAGRYYANVGATNDQGYGDADSTVCTFTTSALSLQKQGAKSIEAEVGGWRTESESDAARSFQRELDIADKHSSAFKDVKLERLSLGDAGFLHSYVFGKKGTAVAIVRSGQDFVRVKVEGQLLKISGTNRFGLGEGVASPDKPIPVEVRHAEIAGILQAVAGAGGATEPQNSKPDLRTSPLLTQVKTPQLATEGLKGDQAGADRVCGVFTPGAKRAGMRLDAAAPDDTNTRGGKIGKWKCTYRASGLVMSVIVSSFPKDGSGGSAAAEHGERLTSATNFARSNERKGEKVSPLYTLPAGQSGYAIYHVAASFGQAKAGFLVGEGTLVEISMSGSRRPEGKILSVPFPETKVLKALATTLG